MSNLKRRYDEITEKRNNIIKELKQLEENEFVKKYFELKEQNEFFYGEQISLYEKIKNEEYDSCAHVLIYSKMGADEFEGRTYKTCGCIKCGLSDSVLNIPRNLLSDEKKIMYDYLKKVNLRGNEIKMLCNLNLACAIYSGIKNAHPDIDDETAIKYFEISLDNIKNIKVSEERKNNRIKRLALNPKK